MTGPQAGPTLDGDALVAAADAIAQAAHQGQTDKVGRDYIHHPRWVAAQFTDPGDRAVALLHDVLEDSDWTAAQLRAAGIPDDVVADVEALTRTDQEPTHIDAIVKAIAAGPRATRVKRADVAHNGSPDRLAAVGDDATRRRLQRKYIHAAELLDEALTTR